MNDKIETPVPSAKPTPQPAKAETPRPATDAATASDKTPQELTADRLYDAVLHLRKGGTLCLETIDDLLKFIRPVKA